MNNVTTALMSKLANGYLLCKLANVKLVANSSTCTCPLDDWPAPKPTITPSVAPSPYGNGMSEATL